MTIDYGSWGQRAVSKGSQAQAPMTSKQVPPMANLAQLPPPPAGYAWALHPQGMMVLMPMQMAPQPYAAPIPPPQQPQQPWGTPAGATLPPGGPRVETCTLVRPGNRDTYAELLERLPDLAPPSGYDAMAGNPSPESMGELARLNDLAFHDVPRAYGDSHRPASTIATLK